MPPLQATGKTVWRATAPIGAEAEEHGAYGTDVIGVRDGSVLVRETDWDQWSNIVALDAENGQRLWDHPASPYYLTALLHGDVVLTKDEGERLMTARAARSGAKRWTSLLPADYACSLFGSGSGLYTFCQRAEGSETLMLVFDPDDSTSRRITELPNGDPLGTHDDRLAFFDSRPFKEAGAGVQERIHTNVVRGAPPLARGPVPEGKETLRVGRNNPARAGAGSPQGMSSMGPAAFPAPTSRRERGG